MMPLKRLQHKCSPADRNIKFHFLRGKRNEAAQRSSQTQKYTCDNFLFALALLPNTQVLY
jgi:hypothetical protein